MPLALRHGAELRPLCEALAIGANGRGYAVRYRDHRTGELAFESAPRLVLAAGGLNTQRLLFEARDGSHALPGLPATLGLHFSPNGDHAALLWRTATLTNTSFGPACGPLSRVEVGGRRFVLAEIGPPVEALPLPGLLKRALERSTLLFCMGQDRIDGTMRFDGTGLQTVLGRSLDGALYDKIEAALGRVAGHYRPRRLVLGFLAESGGEGLFTVHPLGGCAMGRAPADGFTNHLGEVFGHPGLFVADGSLYPRSPGIAPSLTIAALAERQAANMR